MAYFLQINHKNVLQMDRSLYCMFMFLFLFGKTSGLLTDMQNKVRCSIRKVSFLNRILAFPDCAIFNPYLCTF